MYPIHTLKSSRLNSRSTLINYTVICLLILGTEGFQSGPQHESLVSISPSLTRTLNTGDGSGGDLGCIAKPPIDAGLYSTHVPFYFSLESSSSISTSPDLLHDMKRFLFYIIHSIIDWCPVEQDIPESSHPLVTSTTSNHTTVFRNKGRKAGNSGTAPSNAAETSSPNNTQRSSILDIGVASIDEMTDCTCSEANVQTLTGHACRVYEGNLLMYTIEDSSNVNEMIDLLQASVRKIFDEGLLLSNALPTLNRTRWLGNSLHYFDCSATTSFRSSARDETGKESETDVSLFHQPVGSQGTNQSDVPDSSESQEDSSEWLGFVQTTGALVLFIMGCFAILSCVTLIGLVRERRRLSGLFRYRRLFMKWEDNRRTLHYYGTGDPIGSYHYGRYHYMITGERFLSTQCTKCLETLHSDYYAPEPKFRSHEVLSTAKSPTRSNCYTSVAVESHFPINEFDAKCMEDISLISTSKSDDTVNSSCGKLTSSDDDFTIMVETGEDVFQRTQSPRFII